MSLLEGAHGKNYIGDLGKGGIDASAVRLRKEEEEAKSSAATYNGPPIGDLLGKGHVSRP